MNTQFVTDEHGKKVGVILPIHEYKEMMAAVEELDAIQAYDTAKSHPQEFMEAQEAFLEIERERKSKNIK